MIIMILYKRRNMNIMMAISAFSYVLKHFSQNNCEIAWRLQRLFIILHPKVDTIATLQFSHVFNDIKRQG